MSSTPTCTLTACWSWYNVKGQAGVLIQTARWMTGSPSYFFYGPFSLQTWPFGWQPREEHFTGARWVTPGKMKGYRERGCEGWKKNAASIISQMSQAAFQRRENLHFRLLLRMACTHRLCHILHIIHTKVEAFNTRCLFFFLQIGTNKICWCNIYMPLDTNVSAFVMNFKYTVLQFGTFKTDLRFF